MSGPADTSCSERVRRLRGKAVAAGVANGNALDKAQGGYDFDTQIALKMGHQTYTRETPAGPVMESGCGCAVEPPFVFNGCFTDASGSVALLNGPVQIIVPEGQYWNLFIQFQVAGGQYNIEGTGPQAFPNLSVPVGATTFTSQLSCQSPP
jgi:hypothetical protein